jgi:hypothetical protein
MGLRAGKCCMNRNRKDTPWRVLTTVMTQMNER